MRSAATTRYFTYDACISFTYPYSIVKEALKIAKIDAAHDEVIVNTVDTREERREAL